MHHIHGWLCLNNIHFCVFMNLSLFFFAFIYEITVNTTNKMREKIRFEDKKHTERAELKNVFIIVILSAREQKKSTQTKITFYGGFELSWGHATVTKYELENPQTWLQLLNGLAEWKSANHNNSSSRSAENKMRCRNRVEKMCACEHALIVTMICDNRFSWQVENEPHAL